MHRWGTSVQSELTQLKRCLRHRCIPGSLRAGPVPGGAQELFAVVEARAGVGVGRLKSGSRSLAVTSGVCVPQQMPLGLAVQGELWRVSLVLAAVAELSPLGLPSPWPMFPGLRLQGLGAGRKPAAQRAQNALQNPEPNPLHLPLPVSMLFSRTAGETLFLVVFVGVERYLFRFLLLYFKVRFRPHSAFLGYLSHDTNRRHSNFLHHADVFGRNNPVGWYFFFSDNLSRSCV